MRETIFYIIFAVSLFIILSNIVETFSDNQENLEAVSPLITIANLAQGLTNGTPIPSNLQVGTADVPANLSVSGTITTGGISFPTNKWITSNEPALTYRQLFAPGGSTIFASPNGTYQFNQSGGGDGVNLKIEDTKMTLGTKYYPNEINVPNGRINIMGNATGVGLDAGSTNKPWGVLTIGDKCGNAWAFGAGATSWQTGGLDPNVLNLWGYSPTVIGKPIVQFGNNGNVNFSGNVTVGSINGLIYKNGSMKTVSNITMSITTISPGLYEFAGYLNGDQGYMSVNTVVFDGYYGSVYNVASTNACTFVIQTDFSVNKFRASIDIGWKKVPYTNATFTWSCRQLA